jgi:hypothetical protein
MSEQNYPEIIERLKEKLKAREQKARKEASKYNIAKLKQSVTMVEYWEAEYVKHKNSGGEAVKTC